VIIKGKAEVLRETQPTATLFSTNSIMDWPEIDPGLPLWKSENYSPEARHGLASEMRSLW
jgi:hypothetical protein